MPRTRGAHLSIFDGAFQHAMDCLKGRLMETVDLTYAATGATIQLSAAFNEQVGFVDDQRRAVFTFDADDVATPVERGDFFILQGETDRWYAVDIRDDKAGGIEIRCDGFLKRL